MALPPTIQNLIAQIQQKSKRTIDSEGIANFIDRADLESKDRATAAAIDLLSKELMRVAKIVDPKPVTETKVPVIETEPPVGVLDFTYQLTDRNIVLLWTAPTFTFLIYEIREGNVWDTADRVTTTSNLSVILNPRSIGTHRFLLKTINEEGNYSTEVAFVDVVIPPIGSFSVNSRVIDNFVSFLWTIPTSTFLIDFFILSKDGVPVVTQAKGTFFSYPEVVKGQHTYGFIAVDIGGNQSAEVTVILDVKGPVDFDLQEEYHSTLPGTKVNARLQLASIAVDNKLFLPINLTETYQEHFDSRGWASPAAQVAAGYPRWLSPNPLTASYEEIIDFGTQINNVILSVSWQTDLISGSFLYALEVSTSLDGTNYTTPPSTNQSTYVPSLRWAKVKITFEGSDDKAFMAFYHLVVSLNVKRENDAGFGYAVAADVNGTPVRFNKAFVDVEGITVTPLTTKALFTIFDFDDVPNPTGFSVYLFDNAGVRYSENFRWNARGIV